MEGKSLDVLCLCVMVLVCVHNSWGTFSQNNNMDMLMHVLDALNRFIFMFSPESHFCNPFGIYSDIIEFHFSFLTPPPHSLSLFHSLLLAPSIQISLSCVNEFQLTHVLFTATILRKNTIHTIFLYILFRWPFNSISSIPSFISKFIFSNLIHNPIKQSAAFYCCIFPLQIPFLFRSIHSDGFTTSN